MEQQKSQHPDADIRNSMKALIRASKRARLLAQQTRTEFVVIRDGKLIKEIPPLDEVITIDEYVPQTDD